jgi:AraC-like DNA-binding protein
VHTSTAAGTAAGREPAVRGLAITYPSGTVVLPTERGWDHLVYAGAGVMSVETTVGTWVIPPHRAVWAPDATPFRIRMHGRVSVRTLYLRADLAVLAPSVHVVNVPPLVRELILTAVREAPLYVEQEAHRQLIGVLADRLARLPQAPLQLPMPVDARARALADFLLANPDAPIATIATQCGASRRTLERRFADETKMTIGAWRRRARFVEALRLLADGESVTAVAHRVGYSTPSAFTYAFRLELGSPPGTYFRSITK